MAFTAQMYPCLDAQTGSVEQAASFGSWLDPVVAMTDGIDGALQDLLVQSQCDDDYRLEATNASTKDDRERLNCVWSRESISGKDRKIDGFRVIDQG
jgi:hypothetical protein